MSNYRCRHCGGNIAENEEASNENWKIYLCTKCGSSSPLSVRDLTTMTTLKVLEKSEDDDFPTK